MWPVSPELTTMTSVLEEIGTTYVHDSNGEVPRDRAKIQPPQNAAMINWQRFVFRSSLFFVASGLIWVAQTAKSTLEFLMRERERERDRKVRWIL